MTSLMWAAMCGHTEVVKALIDANASLKITNKVSVNYIYGVICSSTTSTIVFWERENFQHFFRAFV